MQGIQILLAVIIVMMLTTKSELQAELSIWKDL